MEMKKSILSLCYLSLIFIALGCSTNPYTDRNQTFLLSESKEIEMGEEQYRKFIEDPNVLFSKDPVLLARVQKVFTRLVNTAKNSKYSETAQKLNWEFTIVKDEKTKDSSSFPGGKVIYYTGLLMMTKNDSELGFITGTLMAKILARHGGEKLSADFFSTLSTSAAGVYIERSAGDTKESQEQKEEADYIGLLLSASAGYDPSESLKRFNFLTGNNNEERYRTLMRHLEEAELLFQAK